MFVATYRSKATLILSDRNLFLTMAHLSDAVGASPCALSSEAGAAAAATTAMLSRLAATLPAPSPFRKSSSALRHLAVNSRLRIKEGT